VKSQRIKYDPVKLRELGKLGANVFAGKKDALERFNEKADELGLAQRIDTDEETSLAAFKKAHNFLRDLASTLPPGGISRAPEGSAYRLFDQRFSEEECGPALTALYKIAISEGGKMGTVATDACLAICSALGPEFDLHEMDFINIINAVGMDGSAQLRDSIRILYSKGVFYPSPESALILNSFVEAMLSAIDIETASRCYEEVAFPFAFLPFATDADLIGESQRKALLGLAAEVLGRFVDGNYHFAAACLFEPFLESLTKDYDMRDEVIMDTVKLLSFLRMDETQKKAINDALDTIIRYSSPPREMMRWHAVNEGRFADTDGQGLGQERIVETVASLQKQLSENSDRLNEALKLIRGILPPARVALESIHRGHIRKYGEAVSSGNFGILEYKGSKIVYALVNYDDIDNIGVNADGLILVARDRTRNGKGKDDKDLQKIVAVHEFVESTARKEGRPSGEAHDLAIKAQEEYVRERGIAKKYADFLANTGQIYSNGNDNFGF
jgi:hypothetical protein